MELKTLFEDRGFHLAHLNVRSLYPKIDILRYHLFSVENLDVLGISETWLNTNIHSDLVNIHGYHLIRHDRNWNHNPNVNEPKKGGGVSIYLKNHIVYDNQAFEKFNRSDKDIEAQWVQVKNNFTKDALLINVYRPPQGNVLDFVDYFENTLSTIDISKFDVFIMGDFNINIQNRNCDNARSLKSPMKTLGFNQLITQPTRIDQNNESCIYLIFSNCDYIAKAGVYSLNISDHELVYCTKKRKSPIHTKKDLVGRSYRNFDKNIFANLLNTCD